MTRPMDRRKFIATTVKTGAALTLASTLGFLSGCSRPKSQRPFLNLVKDPDDICDLPQGFNYTVISKHGDKMSDGHIEPDFHDGMACFEGPEGEIILIRNHEMPLYFPSNPKSPDPQYAYDPDTSGGTTTVWLNEKLEVTQHYLSLTGTILNCCGGKTPWGTWISCEEPSGGAWQLGKRHGYNFEVNPLEQLQKATPLKAMGRFKHEAVAVDPVSGIAYETEDQTDGCFYRFRPNVLEHFEKGGTLQALKFVDQETRHTTADALQLNEKYACEWVSVDEPDPEEDNVRHEAQGKGAAIFVRGEGIVAHPDGIYFDCTSGGAKGIGQIFKYNPDEDNSGGSIELVYEATTAGVLEKPDNITINQWGDLIICEDNRLDKQCLIGLTPEGRIYYIASNPRAEWCGACFSPDGRILFANIQRDPGMTVAIEGPWESLRVSA